MSGNGSQAVLSVTVSPLKVSLPAGRLDHTQRITVANTGPSAFTIHAAPVVLSSSCKVTQAPGWVKVTPAAAVVEPGHSVHARMVVHVPADVHGTVDLAALFTATGAAHGNARVSGAVASQLVVHGGASSATCTGQHHQPVAAAASTSNTGPAALLIGVAIVFLGVVIAAAIWMKQRHKGGHRAA